MCKKLNDKRPRGRPRKQIQVTGVFPVGRKDINRLLGESLNTALDMLCQSRDLEEVRGQTYVMRDPRYSFRVIVNRAPEAK